MACHAVGTSSILVGTANNAIGTTNLSGGVLNTMLEQNSESVKIATIDIGKLL